MDFIHIDLYETGSYEASSLTFYTAHWLFLVAFFFFDIDD